MKTKWSLIRVCFIRDFSVLMPWLLYILYAWLSSQISSIQQVLAQQFSESMMYPLNKFLQADLEGTFITVGVHPAVCGWVGECE